MQRYPLPVITAVKILAAFLRHRKRSFRKDSIDQMKSLAGHFILKGKEHIPETGPYLVTMNHFHQHGFTAWWIGFTVSACLPDEVHWMMTSAWLYEGKFLGKLRENITRFIIVEIARIYGFTITPPMPPNLKETKEGAASIRKLLKYAQDHPQGIIGLAPEGRDSFDNSLAPPPPGTGRLLGHLAGRRYRILPAALYEEKDCLVLRFGPAYPLEVPERVHPQERDLAISQRVMGEIEMLLPIEDAKSARMI